MIMKKQLTFLLIISIPLFCESSDQLKSSENLDETQLENSFSKNIKKDSKGLLKKYLNEKQQQLLLHKSNTTNQPLNNPATKDEKPLETSAKNVAGLMKQVEDLIKKSIKISNKKIPVIKNLDSIDYGPIGNEIHKLGPKIKIPPTRQGGYSGGTPSKQSKPFSHFPEEINLGYDINPNKESVNLGGYGKPGGYDNQGGYGNQGGYVNQGGYGKPGNYEKPDGHRKPTTKDPDKIEHKPLKFVTKEHKKSPKINFLDLKDFKNIWLQMIYNVYEMMEKRGYGKDDPHTLKTMKKLFYLLKSTNILPHKHKKNSCPYSYDDAGSLCLSAEFLHENLDYEEARLYCQLIKGGDLVIIRDACEFKEIVEYLEEIDPYRTKNYWIGANDLDIEGLWRNIDGSLFPLGPPFWGKVLDIIEPSGAVLPLLEEQDYGMMIGSDFFFVHDVSANDSVLLEGIPLCQYIPQRDGHYKHSEKPKGWGPYASYSDWKKHKQNSLFEGYFGSGEYYEKPENPFLEYGHFQKKPQESEEIDYNIPQGGHPVIDHGSYKPNSQEYFGGYDQAHVENEGHQGSYGSSTSHENHGNYGEPSGYEQQGNYGQPTGQEQHGGYGKPSSQEHLGNYGQGQEGSYGQPTVPGQQGNYGQYTGQKPDGSYGQPTGQEIPGSYGQHPGQTQQGSYGQPTVPEQQGNYGQPTVIGNYGQEQQGSYGQPNGQDQLGNYGPSQHQQGSYVQPASHEHVGIYGQNVDQVQQSGYGNSYLPGNQGSDGYPIYDQAHLELNPQSSEAYDYHFSKNEPNSNPLHDQRKNIPENLSVVLPINNGVVHHNGGSIEKIDQTTDEESLMLQKEPIQDTYMPTSAYLNLNNQNPSKTNDIFYDTEFSKHSLVNQEDYESSDPTYDDKQTSMSIYHSPYQIDDDYIVQIKPQAEFTPSAIPTLSYKKSNNNKEIASPSSTLLRQSNQQQENHFYNSQTKFKDQTDLQKTYLPLDSNSKDKPLSTSGHHYKNNFDFLHSQPPRFSPTSALLPYDHQGVNKENINDHRHTTFNGSLLPHDKIILKYVPIALKDQSDPYEKVYFNINRPTINSQKPYYEKNIEYASSDHVRSPAMPFQSPGNFYIASEPVAKIDEHGYNEDIYETIYNDKSHLIPNNNSYQRENNNGQNIIQPLSFNTEMIDLYDKDGIKRLSILAPASKNEPQIHPVNIDVLGSAATFGNEGSKNRHHTRDPIAQDRPQIPSPQLSTSIVSGNKYNSFHPLTPAPLHLGQHYQISPQLDQAISPQSYEVQTFTQQDDDERKSHSPDKYHYVAHNEENFKSNRNNPQRASHDDDHQRRYAQPINNSPISEPQHIKQPHVRIGHKSPVVPSQTSLDPHNKNYIKIRAQQEIPSQNPVEYHNKPSPQYSAGSHDGGPLLVSSSVQFPAYHDHGYQKSDQILQPFDVPHFNQELESLPRVVKNNNVEKNYRNELHYPERFSQSQIGSDSERSMTTNS